MTDFWCRNVESTDMKVVRLDMKRTTIVESWWMRNEESGKSMLLMLKRFVD
jgi:hypothetical protein